MATYRHLTYLILDEIKAISDDSTITEEHVIFLLNHYRSFFIYQRIKAEGVASVDSSNYQTICLELEKTNLLPGNVCSEVVLKSIEPMPSTLTEDTIQVYPMNYLAGTNIAYVSKNRFKYVGLNKYMQNIIYATKSQDDHLYLKSMNPQFQYLKQVQVSALFEDPEKANEYSCDDTDKPCDILDAEFPLDSSMLPQLVEIIVKELSAAEWRQKDDINNSSDDLSNLIAYLAKNTKSSLAKQLAG